MCGDASSFNTKCCFPSLSLFIQDEFNIDDPCEIAMLNGQGQPIPGKWSAGRIVGIHPCRTKFDVKWGGGTKRGVIKLYLRKPQASKQAASFPAPFIHPHPFPFPVFPGMSHWLRAFGRKEC